MRKNQHGEVDISLVDDNIIHAKLIGSFNDVGAHVYAESMKEMVMKLNASPFAILVDNTRMDGGTPEAYEILEEYNQFLTSSRLRAKAIVETSAITTALIRTLSPSVNFQNVKNFMDTPTALQWLKSQLEKP